MTVNLDEFYSEFPVIRLAQVTLREITPEDADSFFEYINNEETKKFLSNDDVPATLEKAREELGYWGKLFRYRHCVYWGIADNETNQLIGTCGYNNWGVTHRRVEISYDLDRRYWGKGIMTDIIGAMCEFAFVKMDVNRVQATVVTDNLGSIRVLEKNGFLREGVLNEFCVIHGEINDSYMYSLLRRNANYR